MVYDIIRDNDSMGDVCSQVSSFRFFFVSAAPGA